MHSKWVNLCMHDRYSLIYEFSLLKCRILDMHCAIKISLDAVVHAPPCPQRPMLYWQRHQTNEHTSDQCKIQKNRCIVNVTRTIVFNIVFFWGLIPTDRPRKAWTGFGRGALSLILSKWIFERRWCHTTGSANPQPYTTTSQLPYPADRKPRTTDYTRQAWDKEVHVHRTVTFTWSLCMSVPWCLLYIGTASPTVGPNDSYSYCRLVRDTRTGHDVGEDSAN